MKTILQLFTGKPFEVQTHFTLDKVHMLLETMLFEMGYYKSKYRGVSITNNQTEAERLDFKADRVINTALYVHVSGSVHPNESGTIVNGEIRLSKFSLGLGFTLFFVVTLIVLGRIMFSPHVNPINNFLQYLVLAGLLATIYLVPCLYVQNKIYREILELSAEHKKSLTS